MRIYKMDDFEWVCIRDRAQAKWFFRMGYGGNEKIKIEEVLLNSTWWYGFDVGDRLDKKVREANEKYRETFNGRYYTVKVDQHADFAFVVKMSYKEIIEYNDTRQPYVIALVE